MTGVTNGDENSEVYFDITTPDSIFQFTIDEIHDGGEPVNSTVQVITLPNPAS